MFFSVTKIMMILTGITTASPAYKGFNSWKFATKNGNSNGLTRRNLFWMSQFLQFSEYRFLLWIILCPISALLIMMFSVSRLCVIVDFLINLKASYTPGKKPVRMSCILEKITDWLDLLALRTPFFNHGILQKKMPFELRVQRNSKGNLYFNTKCLLNPSNNYYTTSGAS